ncbi:hypothetical protein PV325_007723 [Microctonus aethiopoides]|nr:hypothetical protein PV325_007723 [Microctonus aethiopoides]
MKFSTTKRIDVMVQSGVDVCRGSTKRAVGITRPLFPTTNNCPLGGLAQGLYDDEKMRQREQWNEKKI